MNKKLIALAVAGATFAPAVMAQAANPVTLYGRIYVTVESVKASGGSAPLAQRMRVEDQSSFLGVRGEEDLGGGLKATYQLETSFRPDQNTSTFANRNSKVGLKGSFGEVFAGRWDTPFKSANIAIDPFGDLTISGITSAASDKGNFDRRAINNIQYWSPAMSGFAVRASYGVNEGKTATLNPQETSFSLTYNKGPLYAYYAFEQLKDQQAGLTTSSKQEGNSVGGAYTFGPVKVGALYQEFKKTNLTKQKAMMANAVYTTGKHQFIYQYQQAEDGGAINAAQPDCDNNSLGYQYNFTRRTFSLIQYSKTKNNDAATCRIGSFVGGAGSDPEGFSVGLRHVF